jgi:hypothetical protein
MKRNALACSLIISSVISLPMLYQVLINGALSSDVALRRYLVVLAVSLLAGPLLAMAFSGSGGSHHRKPEKAQNQGRRSGDDRRASR